MTNTLSNVSECDPVSNAKALIVLHYGPALKALRRTAQSVKCIDNE
jgi:hypothetical protein